MRSSRTGLQLVAGIGLSAVGIVLLRLAADLAGVAQAQPHQPRGQAAVAGQPTRTARMRSHALAVASYTLSARLDAERHVVSASGALRWTNRSLKPLSELWVHLYLNAFKNQRSRFLRESSGAGRSGRHVHDWGHIDVQRFSVREWGDVDLWPTAAKHSG